MKILVIGRGGREHALVHTVSRNDRVKEIYAALGNSGMAELAECVNIADSGVKGLTVFTKEQEIDLTVVGPEVTLSLGIVDAFQTEGLEILGPTKDAAQVEPNKDFTKKIMARYGIPTASYQAFDNKADAVGYVEHQGVPIVIKEDSLKAGKGVTVTYELEETLDVIEIALSVPGNHAVIEECLEGFEFFLICFVCDDLVLPVEVAQDRRTAYDGDRGPNTGGVDVCSPIEKVTPDIIEETMDAVMIPMAKATVKERHLFTRFLYGGLMLTKHGIRTIEFNACFGDPEAEIILPRLKTNFYDVIENIISHSKTELEWGDGITLSVVMTDESYPASSTEGAVIENLEDVNSTVFHMGAAEKKDSLVTDGGRVLCVCAATDTLEEAYEKAYTGVYRIRCNKLFYRDDIGKKGTQHIRFCLQ